MVNIYTFVYVLTIIEMNEKKYELSISDSYLDFEFTSNGPRGQFKKIIRYSPQNAGGVTYFNLGFGDLNEETGTVDDKVVTNNADRDKILATVATSVLIFTSHFPDALVYATGSTSARTRLYQIGISANWKDIDEILHVYGFEQEKGWQPFQKNFNYQAFLVRRK